MTYAEAVSTFQQRSLDALKVARSSQIASLETTREFAQRLSEQRAYAFAAPRVIRAMTDLTTEFAFTLLEQQVAYAKKLADTFAKPPVSAPPLALPAPLLAIAAAPPMLAATALRDAPAEPQVIADRVSTGTDDTVASETDEVTSATISGAALVTMAGDAAATINGDAAAAITDDAVATMTDDAAATMAGDAAATITDDAIATMTDDAVATMTDDAAAAITDDAVGTTAIDDVARTATDEVATMADDAGAGTATDDVATASDEAGATVTAEAALATMTDDAVGTLADDAVATVADDALGTVADGIEAPVSGASVEAAADSDGAFSEVAATEQSALTALPEVQTGEDISKSFAAPNEPSANGVFPVSSGNAARKPQKSRSASNNRPKQKRKPGN